MTETPRTDLPWVSAYEGMAALLASANADVIRLSAYADKLEREVIELRAAYDALRELFRIYKGK